jgi:hypothetical protein
MKFLEQAVKIEKVDIEGEEEERIHGKLLPNNIRALVIGKGGSGKTLAIINLICSENGLHFRNLYIYSKSLGQKKYKFLDNIFSKIQDDIGYYTFSNTADIIEPDDIPPFSVIILDDISCERQNIVKQYFSMGRHKQVDCFYLCQSYFQIPRHLVRENCNMLLIFEQDHFNTLNIYKSHVNSDVSFDVFVDMCKKCWIDKHGFLFINKDCNIKDGRYRKGFNTIIIP